MNDHLIGQKFNRLTTVRFFDSVKHPNGRSSRRYEFLCDCGKSHVAVMNDVKRGATQSCGCFQAERRKVQNLKHGHTKANGYRTSLYTAWCSMKQRCKDPNCVSWKYYGAKGIKVVWESFEDFLKDMQGSWKSGLSIDRIDTNGHYCKENCRWATSAEQNRNYSRNVMLEFNGQKMCKSDWADLLGIKRATLDQRLWKGWSVERALTTPVDTRWHK